MSRLASLPQTSNAPASGDELTQIQQPLRDLSGEASGDALLPKHRNPLLLWERRKSRRFNRETDIAFVGATQVATLQSKDRHDTKRSLKESSASACRDLRRSHTQQRRQRYAMNSPAPRSSSCWATNCPSASTSSPTASLRTVRPSATEPTRPARCSASSSRICANAATGT